MCRVNALEFFLIEKFISCINSEIGGRLCLVSGRGIFRLADLIFIEVGRVDEDRNYKDVRY